MLARIRYALAACYTHRKQLLAFLADNRLQQTTVTKLSPDILAQLGIEVLVLDFDGVLASHAELHPRPEVLVWLENFVAEWQPRKIFILSNKPTKERQAYFSQHFPALKFIVAKRKKPYPDGLQEICQISGTSVQKIMVVDDRLATGIIAAIANGMHGCWITQPYVNVAARPIRETGFMFLRWLERNLIKHLA